MVSRRRTSKSWLGKILFLATIIFVVAVGIVRAQDAAPEIYFDETGHAVRGEFFVFFNEHGGLAVFGYPITEAFVKDGRLVQYFQRARFELHPENPPDYQVQLSLLGDQLGYNRPGVENITSTNPRCHYFPETRHSICNSFLDYFVANGGLDVFGYPIAEQDVDHGRFVQSFQRMRMEWFPENPVGQRMQLTNLGTRAFEFFKEDSRRLLPSAPVILTQLKLRISVKSSITPRSGEQTVYAIVTNQVNLPMEGATVVFLIHLPTGDLVTQPQVTDDKGRALVSFKFNNLRAGQTISIEATATLSGKTASSRTSFLPWQ